MSARIPEKWLNNPPLSLVVGSGSFAKSLAMILNAPTIGSSVLSPDLVPSEDGALPQVLGSLERVILVAGAGDAASDLLRWHEAVWQWVEKLSPNGDQHELSILFVVPPAAGESLEAALAAGLGLERFAAGTPGHGFICMDTPLPDLLVAVVATPPQDLPPLRARQAGDRRHAALKALIEASEDEVPAVARRVNEAFRGQEYMLDLFCRPPSHRNGNQLRAWLNRIVTGDVTPYGQAVSQEPSKWLADQFYRAK